MTKNNHLLHIDFKSYHSVSKIQSPILIGIVTCAVGVVIFLLIVSFGLHHVSHYSAIIALGALAIALPYVFKDVYFDDMAWPKYASKIVQTVDPVDVHINYGFVSLDKSCSEYYEISDQFYLSVSSHRLGNNRCYKIAYPQKSVVNYASKFPLLKETEKVNEMKRNPLTAQAYIDPDTGNAVMIELDQLRFWVERVL